MSFERNWTRLYTRQENRDVLNIAPFGVDAGNSQFEVTFIQTGMQRLQGYSQADDGFEAEIGSRTAWPW